MWGQHCCGELLWRFGAMAAHMGKDLRHIRKMRGETASCAFSAAEISTSQLSISFPAHCHNKGREIGQFVIINMHAWK
jgi:hypothetical protein